VRIDVMPADRAAGPHALALDHVHTHIDGTRELLPRHQAPELLVGQAHVAPRGVDGRHPLLLRPVELLAIGSQIRDALLRIPASVVAKRPTHAGAGERAEGERDGQKCTEGNRGVDERRRHDGAPLRTATATGSTMLWAFGIHARGALPPPATGPRTPSSPLHYGCFSASAVPRATGACLCTWAARVSRRCCH